MATPVTDRPARRLLHEFRAACVAHTEVMDQVTLLLRQRPLMKLEAIVRLMTRADLPPGGAWPWTRAENLTRIDADYDSYKQQCEEAAVALQAATYRVQAAQYELELLISGRA